MIWAKRRAANFPILWRSLSKVQFGGAFSPMPLPSRSREACLFYERIRAGKHTLDTAGDKRIHSLTHSRAAYLVVKYKEPLFYGTFENLLGELHTYTHIFGAPLFAKCVYLVKTRAHNLILMVSNDSIERLYTHTCEPDINTLP